MNIRAITQIQSDAMAAYAAGADKCLWPIDVPEHDVWVDAFVAAAVAGDVTT